MRYVYLIKNLVNSKVYVGQTKNLAVRKSGHLRAAKCGNVRPLYASIRKHGESNFTFEVLEECADETINEREQHWVVQFDSFNPEKGYNLTNGGRQPLAYSEETLQKLRECGRRGKGRKHTLEARQHMSQAHKGKKLSDECRQQCVNILLAHPFKGKQHTQNAREKMRRAKLGSLGSCKKCGEKGHYAKTCKASQNINGASSTVV